MPEEIVAPVEPSAPAAVSEPVSTQESGQPVAQTSTTPESASDPWNGLRDTFASQFEDEAERESVSKWLGRYATPTDVIKAAWVNNQKFQRGELIPALGKNPTPEKIKAFADAMGVPEKPDDYFAKLPDGLVIGEIDKPVFDKLAAHMHAKGVPAPYVQEVAAFYYDWQQQAQDEFAQTQAKMDGEFAKEAQSTLKQKWGADFSANMEHLNSFVGNWLPPDAMEQLTQARMPDGRLLFDNPVIAEAFHALARENNPIPSVVGTGPASVKSLEDRAAELEHILQTDRKRYFRERLSDEYGRIQTALDKAR